MAYLLNSVDLSSTYGITASHAPESNIAMAGIFDMPQRIGTTYKDWGDADGVEPWTNAGEIIFGGRDIVFHGFLTGTVSAINTKLATFYTAIDAATGISIFSTPYNSASGYIKSVIPEHLPGGCTVKMTFREPAVTLTGTLPASGTSVAYMIDNIPFSSFGLYLSKAERLHDLPENKEQFFTKYGQEGYQIVKRKNKMLEMNGFVTGSSLSNFITNVKALYKCFSSSGTRTIVLDTTTTVVCFATEGFKIDNIYYLNTGVIGRFHINLMMKSVAYYTAPTGDPACLSDANHWWYDATDSITITKDVSNYVSAWNSKGGIIGRNLLQATGTKQPLWVTPGTIQFDGIDNTIKASAFTWNQPEFIYILFKMIAWTSGKFVFAGNTWSNGYMYMITTSPILKVYAGAASFGLNALSVGAWGIARVKFNGASSKFMLNATTDTTTNFGTNNIGGLCIGSSTGSADYSNIEVHTIVCVDIDDSANEAEIYAWLITRIPT